MKKDIVKVYLIQLITIIVSFSSSILISRILGADGRGYFSLYQNSSNFAIVLFGFSLTSSIPYFINSLKIESNKIFYTSLSIILVSCFFLMITLYIFEELNLNHLVFPSSIFFYKIVFLSYFLFQTIFGITNGILNSNKKFTVSALLSFLNLLFPVFLYLAIMFKMIHIEDNVKSIITGLLISSILTCTISIFILFKNKLLNTRISILNNKYLKTFLTFSLLAYFGNIASFICYKFDFWIIDSYHGKAALGVYSLSSQLAQMLWILPQIMASVLYTYASSSSKEEGIILTVKVTKIAMYLTLLIAIVGILLAGPIIPILYGTNFSGVTILLAIQIIGTIPFCIPTVLSSFYASQGNFKISFWISIIVTVISISLYFLLIPKYGNIGGSIASASTYFLGGIFSLLYFCYKYKIHIKEVILIKKEDLTTFIKLIKK